MTLIENDKKKVESIIEKSIDLLCNTVKRTLGPKGSNVLIESDTTNPYITNDGVTIAKEINSDNRLINAVLTICKEASIKTDEEVGDGTTSTLVLLQSIYKEAKKVINDGCNEVILQKELLSELDKILKLLEQEKDVMTINNIFNIAKIASGDEFISSYLEEIYLNLGFNALISVSESLTDKSYFEISSGMNIETSLASFIF